MTEPARSISDWESSFYKQIKKLNSLWHTYISFEKRAESHSYYYNTIFPCSDWDTLSGKKKSGKIFVVEKISHFWKISHFSPTNFSNSSLFPDQFLKLKGLSWVGLLFFQRKVVPLVWHFSNWAWRSALLVSLTMELGVANTFLRRYHKKSFCLS